MISTLQQRRPRRIQWLYHACFLISVGYNLLSTLRLQKAVFLVSLFSSGIEDGESDPFNAVTTNKATQGIPAPSRGARIGISIWTNSTIATKESYSDERPNGNQILQSTAAAIQPLPWSCLPSSKGALANLSTKLIFVHIFKTAGSTLRGFFRDYAQECYGKSYATITGCTNLPLGVLEGTQWKPCHLKDVVNRQGQHHVFREDNDGFVNASYLQTDLDVIGGHFRLGLMEDHLPRESPGNKVPSSFRTVAFFRDAAAKYVSGKLFLKFQQSVRKQQSLIPQSIVTDIEREVDDALRAKKHHSKYRHYLLTPDQERRRQSEHWSYRRQVETMQQNLLDYNVTIGMVESMPESLQLLQRVMNYSNSAAGGTTLSKDDGLKNATDSAFLESRRRLSSTTTGDTIANMLPTIVVNATGRPLPSTRNHSPISTSKLLSELQDHNGELYTKLLEFVKYEQQVTDFARMLHERQYQAMMIELRS